MARRGIALITVMMVMGVMALMLASFVRLNRHHFGMLQNDQNHVAAAQAAYTAFDYCRYRLERERGWGAAAFNGFQDPVTSGFLSLEEVKDTHRLEGKVTQGGAEFQAVILNNIDNKGKVDGVPPGFCRIRITGSRGSATVRCEAMLDTAPLFDGAVVSSKDITVDANSLTVSSTDPFRNRLRAKQAISVPDYDGNFTFDPAADATERGVLWAQDGIFMGNRSLTDPENAAEAAQKTGGRFYPKAKTQYDVYDLQLSEVKAPSTEVEIDSGIYVFNVRPVEYTNSSNETQLINVPVVERRDWAVDNEGNIAPTQGDVREVWYLTSQLPEDRKSDLVSLYNEIPEEGLHAVPEGVNSIPLDTGVQIHFNSLDPEYTGQAAPPSIVLNSDVNLTVKGDFGVASWDGRYNPTIIFRDPETGAVGSVSGAITATATEDGKQGSIYLEGYIAGNGKLLAQGDVTVRNTFADVSADKLSDLSIYAGGSVKIKPQKAKSFDDATVFNYGDYDGHTAFRGLVFAKDNVIIEANKDEGEGYDPVNVRIEGAVVARNGEVMVRGADNVNFVYNPEYLDSILQRKGDDEHIRLERVVWKES